MFVKIIDASSESRINKYPERVAKNGGKGLGVQFLAVGMGVNAYITYECNAEVLEATATSPFADGFID